MAFRSALPDDAIAEMALTDYVLASAAERGRAAT